MILFSAAAPIAVKSATGVLTAAGVWSGVAVVVVAMIGAVVAYIKIMPRLRELEDTKKLRLLELENNNNAGLRKEFIEEMAELRAEVRNLRKEVQTRDDKIDLLRAEITELHGLIDGMRRENQAAQISGQRVIADTLKSLPQSGGSA